jgi:hypothetical protein
MELGSHIGGSLMPHLADPQCRAVIFNDPRPSHDSNLVADAIQNLERYLAFAGIEFTTVFLPDVVCAIGLGAMAQRLALELELEPYAISRTQFLSEARRQVWASIVWESLVRGDVSSRSDLDTSQKECVALRLAVDQTRRTLRPRW